MAVGESKHVRKKMEDRFIKKNKKTKTQERYCDGTRKQKNSEGAQEGKELNVRGDCEFRSVNLMLESGEQRGAKAREREMGSKQTTTNTAWLKLPKNRASIDILCI